MDDELYTMLLAYLIDMAERGDDQAKQLAFLLDAYAKET